MGFIAQNEGPIYECLGERFPALHPFWTPSAVQLQCYIYGTQLYPVWSITLQKIILINLAVKAGIENDKQVETIFMEYDRTKYLVNICKILKTE